MSTRQLAKILVSALLVAVVAGCSAPSASPASPAGQAEPATEAAVEAAVEEARSAIEPAIEAAARSAVESALSVPAGWVERRIELVVAGAELEMVARLSWDAGHAERDQLFEARGPGVIGDELENVRAAMAADADGRNGSIDRDTLLAEQALIGASLEQLLLTTDAVSEIVEGRLVTAAVSASARSGSAGEYWNLGVGDPTW